jgi:phosphoglycolate phosphatase-like HAD superfamily hydrolase
MIQGKDNLKKYQTQYVFLDWDGTITDTSKRYYKTYKDAINSIYRFQLKNNGISTIKPLDFWEFKELKRERSTIEDICKRSKVPPEFFVHYKFLIENSVNSPGKIIFDRLFSSSRRDLVSLNNAGFKLIVVTLNQEAYVQSVVQRLNLPIDAVYGSKGDIFQEDQLSFKKRRVSEAISREIKSPFEIGKHWMVGDTETDIYAGNANGLSTIALTWGMRSFGCHMRSEHVPNIILPNLTAVQRFLTSQIKIAM